MGSWQELSCKYKGKRSLENRRYRWKDNTEMDLSNNGVKMLIWFIWFRVGSGGRLTWMQSWTFGIHKGREIWLLEYLYFFAFMYRKIIIPDSSYHFSFRSFCLVTDTTVHSTFPICSESGSTCFSSVYCNYY
jgi:hypothetical protein